MSLSRFNLPMEVTPEKTIMAMRMGIGIIISFVITNYFNVVDPTWVYISLFVVLFEQRTVGASLIRGSMRAIATISSAIYSLIIILMFHNNYVMNMVGFIIGTFLYTYLFLGTKKSYIGALGSITLAICLVNYNDFSHVFLRPTNVVIGILVGVFTLRFFFPRRATKLLIIELQKFIDEYISISNYLANIDESTTDVRERLIKLETNVIPAIPRFQTLISEAEIETSKDSKFTKIASDMVLPIRHIFRYYAAILAAILFENVKIDEEDKQNLIFLAQLMTKLKNNLSHLKPKRKLIVISEMLKPKDEEKIIPPMLHLIILECSDLEIKINQLLSTIKTVKLE